MIVIIRAGKGVEKFCYSTLPVTVILQLTKPTSGRCSLFIPSENTRGFLMFSWGIEMEDYPEIGYSLWKQF